MTAAMRGSLLALPVLLLAACACSTPSHRAAERWRVEPWPAAERMFRGDPDWRGGDAAYAIPLDAGTGEARTLWLFGDSFVARAPGATQRAGCAMVRNSIGVQHGADPESARMEFAWRRGKDGPADWLPPDGDTWHWPLHGLCVGDAVIVFCTRVVRDADPRSLGFRATGWTAFRLGGIAGPPAEWSCERLAVPEAAFAVVVGTAVVAEGGHVHAFALREPGDHAVSLVRWPREAFARGELLAPQWWDGDRWRPHAQLTAAPAPLFAEGAPEFTVLADPRHGYVMVQSLGFGASELAVRTAPALTGPWSAPSVLFRPPGSDREGVFTYAGKGVRLRDGTVLATWASNAWDFGRLVRDETLYYPHCVRLWP
jgi:hypothetical protein